MTTSEQVIIILQHLVISIIGTIGNVLVLIVYKTMLKNKHLTNMFIIHLTQTDLICCLVLLPLNCYHELNIGDFSSDFMCKFHSFLNILNITYSCQIMMLVSFERYFSIFYPNKKFTRNQVKAAMGFLFTICFIMGSLGFASLGINHKVHITHLKNNTTQIDILDSYYDEPHHEQNSVNYNNTIEYLYPNLQSHGTTNLYNSVTTQKVFDNINMNMGDFSHVDYSSQNFSYGKMLPSKGTISMSNFTIHASVWMATKNCFPNNKIISIRTFAMIRSFQNFLLFVNFTVIFVNYAMICIYISKRRNLKMQKLLHYRNVLNASRRKITRNKTNESIEMDVSQCVTRNLNDDNTNTHIGYDSNLTDSNNNTELVTISLQPTKSIFQDINIAEVKYFENLVANIKTALILFVVSLIMAVVYTPALLTSLGFIDYNSIHWNIIYINNASNPIVYSFMNSNFRKCLKKYFKDLFKRFR